MALLNRPLNVTAPTSPAAAAFAPMPGPKPVAPAAPKPSAGLSAFAPVGTQPAPVTSTAVPRATNPKAPPIAPLPPPAPPTPLQAPGNNLVNPGYGEQALEYTQNRLLEDPSAGLLQQNYAQTQAPTGGEQYLNQNLGTLNGPGQGDQYWNQVQGQFMDPFAGEQFARQATQAMAPSGAAGAFFNQAQGQYNQFTGYQGPQNTQGQYGQSSAALAGGTQGEQNLGGIAGQYDSVGRYNDPNLAAGQYAQTQGAFGALPIAEFDPFYDRASQLGVQKYNQNAAGRGVYGSSEALSGVGNVITDIEAQRANRSFDAEMQRTQEQRARQQLLGEQARMGDLSSIAGFGANLAGAETFGNLSNMQGNLELNRNQLLGNMANQADSQALGAQNANLAGLNAFGNLAGQADTAETNRFQARTNAMNQADRTSLDRMTSGADIAFRGDDSARADYQAETNAATQAANLGMDRTRLGADIASQLSSNDLNRLNAFNNQAQGAESQRFQRQVQTMADQFKFSSQVQSALSEASANANKYGADEFESWVNAEIAPSLQNAALSQQQKKELYSSLRQMFNDAHGVAQDLED